MSDSSERGRVPRGVPRVPLPHLEAVLTERRKSKRWATGILGVSPTMFAENSKKGWPRPDAERLAVALGVPLATLSAQGPAIADAPAVVVDLLAQREIATRYAAAREAILAELDALMRDVTASTVTLIARGRVASPDPVRDDVARAVAAARGSAARPRRQATGE